MNITANMKIIGQEKLLAVGDVILDNLFVIQQVKVFQNNQKTNVYFPKRQVGKEEKEVVLFTDPETQKQVETAVLKEVTRLVRENVGWDYCMEDIRISIRRVEGLEYIRGFASLYYKNCMEIREIQIREQRGSLYVLYPHGLYRNQPYQIVCPAAYNVLFLELLNQEILEAYKKAAEQEKLPGKEKNEHERSK
mgnify:CR=1 FL=1